jgi:hypothetical protein
MYSEATVRILSSLNICLQQDTGFTAAIYLITRLLVMSVHKRDSPLNPPSIIYQTEEMSGILQSKCFGSSTDLDFLQILRVTLFNLFANNWVWQCHFSVSVIRIPRKFVSDV